MFQVKGIKNFWSHFPTEISFVRKELTKNHDKIDKGGFIPFYCLISSNAVKIGHSFVNKKSKTPSKTVIFENLKTWRLEYSKNLGCHVFFVQNFHFSGSFWFLWRRHNLVTRTLFQLWWFFLPLIKQIIQFFSSKSWKL